MRFLPYATNVWMSFWYTLNLFTWKGTYFERLVQMSRLSHALAVEGDQWCTSLIYNFILYDHFTSCILIHDICVCLELVSSSHKVKEMGWCIHATFLELISEPAIHNGATNTPQNYVIFFLTFIGPLRNISSRVWITPSSDLRHFNRKWTDFQSAGLPEPSRLSQGVAMQLHDVTLQIILNPQLGAWFDSHTTTTTKVSWGGIYRDSEALQSHLHDSRGGSLLEILNYLPDGGHFSRVPIWFQIQGKSQFYG